MLPVVVLVGRPNVGKSTLFNRLTGTRDALVADMPGVTRDRQYGYGKLGPVPYVVVDTGGLVEHPSGIETPMRLQTERAVAEADVLVFLADARTGLTPQDYWVTSELRRSGKKVVLAVNKAEGLDPATAAADFHSLGLGDPIAIASATSSRMIGTGPVWPRHRSAVKLARPHGWRARPSRRMIIAPRPILPLTIATPCPRSSFRGSRSWETG